jgi:hypothetical protein
MALLVPSSSFGTFVPSQKNRRFLRNMSLCLRTVKKHNVWLVTKVPMAKQEIYHINSNSCYISIVIPYFEG